MKPRLLATDRDSAFLEIYQHYFPNFGFEVATASDGLECLELLRDFVPDILILGLELLWGGADGVLAIVREEPEMRTIPVVLAVDGRIRSKALKHVLPSVVRFLRKPFRSRDLRAVVKTALQARADRLVAGASDPPPVLTGDRGRAANHHNSFPTRIH